MSTFSRDNGPGCGDGGGWLPIINSIKDLESNLAALQAILKQSAAADSSGHTDSALLKAYNIQSLGALSVAELATLSSLLVNGAANFKAAINAVSLQLTSGASIGAQLNTKDIFADGDIRNRYTDPQGQVHQRDLYTGEIFGASRLEFEVPKQCNITCNHYYLLAKLQQSPAGASYYRPAIVFLNTAGSKKISALVQCTPKDVMVIYDKDSTVPDLAFGMAQIQGVPYLYCYARSSEVGSNLQVNGLPNGLYRGQYTALPQDPSFNVGDWCQLLSTGNPIYVVTAKASNVLTWSPYGSAYLTGVNFYASYINAEPVTDAVALSPDNVQSEVHCKADNGIAFTFLNIAQAEIDTAKIGELEVTGDIATNGEIDAAGDIHTGGTLDATDGLSTDGDLDVGGDIEAVGDLDVGGNINASGNIFTPGLTTDSIKDSQGHNVVDVAHPGGLTIGDTEHQLQLNSTDRPTVLQGNLSTPEQIAYLSDFAGNIVYQDSVDFYDTDPAHLPTTTFPRTSAEAAGGSKAYTGQVVDGMIAVILASTATDDSGLAGYYQFDGSTETWSKIKPLGNPQNGQIWEWDAEYIMEGTDTYWHNARILWSPESEAPNGQKVFIVNLPLENYYDKDQIDQLMQIFSVWPDWKTPLSKAFVSNPLTGTDIPNPAFINNKPVTGMSILDGGSFTDDAGKTWDFVVEGGDYTDIDSDTQRTLTNSPNVDEYANVIVKVCRGLKTQMPAPDAVLGPGPGARAANVSYMMYYCVDTQEMFISNGTAWKRLNDPDELHIRQLLTALGTDPLEYEANRTHDLIITAKVFDENNPSGLGSNPHGGGYAITILDKQLKIQSAEIEYETPNAGHQTVEGDKRLVFSADMQPDGTGVVYVSVRVQDKLPHSVFSDNKTGDTRDQFVVNGLDTDLNNSDPIQLLRINERMVKLSDPYVTPIPHFEANVTIQSIDRILQSTLEPDPNPAYPAGSAKLVKLSSPRVQDIEKNKPNYSDIVAGDKSAKVQFTPGTGYDPTTGQYVANPQAVITGQLPEFFNGVRQGTDQAGTIDPNSEYILQITTDDSTPPNYTMKWIKKLLPAESASFTGAPITRFYGTPNPTPLTITNSVAQSPAENSSVWIGSDGSPGSSTKPNIKIRGVYSRASGDFKIFFDSPFEYPYLIPGDYTVRFVSDEPNPNTGAFASVEIPVTVVPVNSSSISITKDSTDASHMRYYVGGSFDPIDVRLNPSLNSDYMAEQTTTGWFNYDLTSKDVGTIQVPSSTAPGSYAVTILAKSLAGDTINVSKTFTCDVIQLTTGFVLNNGTSENYVYNISSPPSAEPTWIYDRLPSNVLANDDITFSGTPGAFTVSPVNGAGQITVTKNAGIPVGRYELTIASQDSSATRTLILWVIDGTTPGWTPTYPATSLVVTSLQNMVESSPGIWTVHMGNQSTGQINLALQGPGNCDDIIQYNWKTHNPALMGIIDVRIACPSGLAPTPNLLANVSLAYSDGAARPAATNADNYIELEFYNAAGTISNTLRIYIHI